MKNPSKTILTMLAVGLLSCGLFCQQAQAMPISPMPPLGAPVTGDITFGGVVTLDSTSLAAATQVSTWNTSFVTSSSGGFSGIAFGTAVTMTAPWTFNSGSHPALWSVGGFTFDLTASHIVSQSSMFLNVLGTGTVSGNGFTPTSANWSFSISNPTGGNQMTFGFTSDTTSTAATPDGGMTVALLGIAFVGLEGLRRKLRARSKRIKY
jgi:hypothetical protein